MTVGLGIFTLVDHKNNQFPTTYIDYVLIRYRD